MRFLTYGDKEKRTLMLIHGMANTSDLFDPLLPYLRDYYVIVCELDGHSPNEQGDFVSVIDAAQKIEKYVKDNLNGRLYGLLGFSLGGTIATELISRGNIEVARTVLDAAFVVKMGILTYPFKWLFQGSIWSMKKNIHVPKPLVESIMGKGNSGIADTLYRGISLKSVGNAALSCYTYTVKEGIRDYHNPVVFWHGENEPYPVKSAKLLKKYLPQMKKRVFKGMGHGQMLHEHTEAYAKRLIAFMEG
ncbi:MAG: alpha/beta hydrolase [Lachnospiraceae bacterium]|jgi:pimeloyl-ACP methyl ester carboxylesterase|nr:alpha/beta hydrolase [Lachnospiraceae bacterium]